MRDQTFVHWMKRSDDGLSFEERARRIREFDAKQCNRKIGPSRIITYGGVTEHLWGHCDRLGIDYRAAITAIDEGRDPVRVIDVLRKR